MNTLLIEVQEAKAQHVIVTEDTLTVDLVDGRSVSVPIGWFPRLKHGKPEERNNWRFIGKGNGIHWPELDEDISVNALLTGKPSGESQSSLKRWLQEHEAHSKIFKLTLHPTYYVEGFFNITIDYDEYVRQEEGSIPIIVEIDDQEIMIEGFIDRSANTNQTARIRGRSKLREWFQSNCNEMDTLYVDLSSLEEIRISKEPTTRT